jgi:Flp pilus assembly protein TadD
MNRLRRGGAAAPGPATPALDRRRLVLAALGLVALTVAVYAGVWSFEFIQFDDPTYIVQNPNLADGLTWPAVQWAFTAGYASNWHPLTWLSHLLDVELFGLRPGPMHLVNLLLHLANTMLLFGWLAWTTRAIGRSLVVAALFAIHPAHVESVAWISERKDVLSTAFWLLTMWAYVFYVRKPGIARYALVGLTFAVGLLAKPMLVTLPLVLLLLDLWPLDRLRPANALRLTMEKLPLLALSVLSSIATFMAQKGGGSVMALDVLPVSSRVMNALVSYVTYIGNMFWPVDLYMYYPHAPSFPLWQIAACAAVLLAISGVAFRLLRSHAYVAVGWLWYLGTLVPVIGLVQVGRQALADRYTYVPFIGLFVIVAWGMHDLLLRVPVRRVVGPAVAALVIAAAAGQAHAQVQFWRNDQLLWTRALKIAMRMDDRITERAVSDLLSENSLTPLQALLEAREGAPKRLGPATARLVIGQLFMRHQHVDEAVTVLSEGVQLAPQLPEMHSALGLALSTLGRRDEAVTAYREALRLNPNMADVHNDLGFVLAQQGKLPDAVDHFAAAARIRPDLIDAHRNLGLALANLGRFDEAIQQFKEVLRLKPDDANVRRAMEDLQKRTRGGK